MGKGLIISSDGSGLYTVKVLKKTTNIQKKIEDKTNQIEAITKEIAELEAADDPENQYIIDGLKLEKIALEKEIERLQTIIDDSEMTIPVWCADATEDLTGEVGLIEIARESGKGINIRPGFNGSAAWDAERDGIFAPAAEVGPWTFAFNQAVEVGLQTHKAVYRYATITAINVNVCSVLLDETLSEHQSLDVNSLNINAQSKTKITTLDNVEIQYMECNGEVFQVDDRVIVEIEGTYDNQSNWLYSTKKVIGFERNPRSCTSFAYQVWYSHGYDYNIKYFRVDSAAGETVQVSRESLEDDYALDHPINYNKWFRIKAWGYTDPPDCVRGGSPDYWGYVGWSKGVYWDKYACPIDYGYYTPTSRRVNGFITLPNGMEVWIGISTANVMLFTENGHIVTNRYVCGKNTWSERPARNFDGYCELGVKEGQYVFEYVEDPVSGESHWAVQMPYLLIFIDEYGYKYYSGASDEVIYRGWKYITWPFGGENPQITYPLQDLISKFQEINPLAEGSVIDYAEHEKEINPCYPYNDAMPNYWWSFENPNVCLWWMLDLDPMPCYYDIAFTENTEPCSPFGIRYYFGSQPYHVHPPYTSDPFCAKDYDDEGNPIWIQDQEDVWTGSLGEDYIPSGGNWEPAISGGSSGLGFDKVLVRPEGIHYRVMATVMDRDSLRLLNVKINGVTAEIIESSYSTGNVAFADEDIQLYQYESFDKMPHILPAVVKDDFSASDFLSEIYYDEGYRYNSYMRLIKKVV